MLGSIFETVLIIGGLRENEEILVSTSTCSPRTVTSAIVTTSVMLDMPHMDTVIVYHC